MPRPNSKDAILEAAESIVTEYGAAHMTLDAVAQRCGISKGGLIYNFPTKEALIHGMLARHMQRMDDLRQQARLDFAGQDANELMVEIAVALALPACGGRLHSALLAVIANEPSLMHQFRDDSRARFQQVMALSSSFDRAAILFFAALGLHFHDLLELPLVTDSQRTQLHNRLLELARGDAPLSSVGTSATDKSHAPKPKKRGHESERGQQ